MAEREVMGPISGSNMFYLCFLFPCYWMVCRKMHGLGYAFHWYFRLFCHWLKGKAKNEPPHPPPSTHPTDIRDNSGTNVNVNVTTSHLLLYKLLCLPRFDFIRFRLLFVSFLHFLAMSDFVTLPHTSFGQKWQKTCWGHVSRWDEKYLKDVKWWALLFT